MSRTVRRTSILMIIILIFLGTGIGIGGFIYYLRVMENITSKITNELEAVADLKVEQLYRWHNERIADATVLRNDPFFSESVRKIINHSQNTIVKEKIIQKLKSIAENYDYKDIWLTDTKGNLILSASRTVFSIDSAHVQFINQIARDQEIRFYDFHMAGPQTNDVHLDLCLPVASYSKGVATPIAVAVIRIDPSTFLYPYIQTWPTPSETAETLIFRENEDEIVFLNNLRHNDTISLAVSFPVSSPDLPAAMAIRGQTGTVEGRDYRNEPVVAAIRKIPETPWYMVSKIDKDEIDDPIRAQFLPIAILIGSFMLLCVLGILLVNRWQRQHFYRQQYLADSEKKALSRHFEYLTKYANDIILLFDKETQIVEANEKAVTTYGYSYDELLNLKAVDLRTPEEAKKLPGIIGEVSETGGKIYESVQRKKDGATFPVEISSRLITIEGRKYYQSIIRDITERVIRDRELERLNRQLEGMVNERTAELKVTNKELESFAYTVSHDLRAPLRHMSGYVNFFMEEYGDKVDKDAVQYLDKVIESSNTMGELIDALLQFSRLGRSEMSKESVDVNHLISEAIERLAGETTGRKIEWDIKTMPTVKADKNLLRQVFINLISNALKFTRDCETVKIRIGHFQKDHQFVFFVKDNGVGFDMTYSGKLFNVFQRLHSDEEFEGTGIGLANVRRIVERHGGRVWAEGEVEKGAAFYFTLPKYQDRL